MLNKPMALNIQLFADGGGDGAGAAETSAAVSQPQSGEEKVVYGKQPQNNVSVAGEQSGAGEDSSKKSYEELIKGEYKNDYDKDVQHIVGKRLAQERAKLQPMTDIIDRLMIRYDAKDIAELGERLVSDEAYESLSFEDREDPRMKKEVEDLKVYREKVKRQEAYREAEMAAQAQYQKWNNEAEEVKKVFPDFDLETELQNPHFKDLVVYLAKNPEYPMTMLEAFKMLHHDDIVKKAEAEALNKAAKSVNLSASRPSENGLGNQSAVIVKDDVSKLNKKDRADIARRVARGEKITF